MVRTSAHQLRPVAADSAEAEVVKVISRTHKTLIWERCGARGHRDPRMIMSAALDLLGPDAGCVLDGQAYLVGFYEGFGFTRVAPSTSSRTASPTHPCSEPRDPGPQPDGVR